MACIDVTALGSEKWHVQFEQRGLDLLDSEPYTLAFWARADRPRPISLNGNVTVRDGHGIGLTQDDISLTPAWRKYLYTFTVCRPAKDHCRITFLLGGALGTVYLSDPVLRHGKLTRPVGPNLVRGGAFDAAVSSAWTFGAKEPASGSMQVQPVASAPPGVNSRVAHLEMKRLGSEDWHLQLVQGGLDLEQGATYSLSFWAKADQARPLPVQVSADVPDWHRVAPDSLPTVTPDWKRYELLFTAAHPVRGHSRVVFVLGGVLGNLDLADVALRREALPGEREGASPATAAGADSPQLLIGAWESEPTSGRRVLFMFNSDGTGSMRSVGGPGSSTVAAASAADAFLWHVQAGAGRRVVIGSKAYTWTVAAEGARTRLNLVDSSGKAHTLFRR